MVGGEMSGTVHREATTGQNDPPARMKMPVPHPGVRPIYVVSRHTSPASWSRLNMQRRLWLNVRGWAPSETARPMSGLPSPADSPAAILRPSSCRRFLQRASEQCARVNDVTTPDFE